MEKVQIGCGCYWCGSGDLFLFNFELLHSHFPVWLVSVFVSGVSGLLDLWMAGGKFSWDFFFIFIFFRSTHGGPPAPPEGLTLRTDVPSSPPSFSLRRAALWGLNVLQKFLLLARACCGGTCFW